MLPPTHVSHAPLRSAKPKPSALGRCGDLLLWFLIPAGTRSENYPWAGGHIGQGAQHAHVETSGWTGNSWYCPSLSFDRDGRRSFPDGGLYSILAECCCAGMSPLTCYLSPWTKNGLSPPCCQKCWNMKVLRDNKSRPKFCSVTGD